MIHVARHWEWEGNLLGGLRGDARRDAAIPISPNDIDNDDNITEDGRICNPPCLPLPFVPLPNDENKFFGWCPEGLSVCMYVYMGERRGVKSNWAKMLAS